MGLAEILVLVPVYRRPDSVRRLLDSFHRSKPRGASVLFIASPGDTQELAALTDAPHITVPFRQGRGDWAKKINHAYRETTAPWLLCAADDIRFHRGWDTALRKAMKSGKRVLGTNDLNPHSTPGGIYSPHPLVARSYADSYGTVDRQGLIMCEQYHHNYPDRELSATAISRDEWLYVPDAILEHLHPGWTGAAIDETYRVGAGFGMVDYRLYVRRHVLWRREKRIRERALARAH